MPSPAAKSAQVKPFPVAKAPGPEKSIPENETDVQAACRETWHAYADAYSHRYGAPPVRNAKVNGQVKQLVSRLGRDEAPMVAAFFVSHQNGYYLKKLHDFGSLVSDAEKLRTEWVTGRMVTATSAQQSDRTQSNMSAAQEAMAMMKAEGY